MAHLKQDSASGRSIVQSGSSLVNLLPSSALWLPFPRHEAVLSESCALQCPNLRLAPRRWMSGRADGAKRSVELRLSCWPRVFFELRADRTRRAGRDRSRGTRIPLARVRSVARAHPTLCLPADGGRLSLNDARRSPTRDLQIRPAGNAQAPPLEAPPFVHHRGALEQRALPARGLRCAVRTICHGAPGTSDACKVTRFRPGRL